MNAKNLILNTIVYFLLALSVYWGTALAFFSFWEFYKSIKFTPDFFQAVYGLLGLVAWLNAWYYHKKIKKQGVIALWQKFYAHEKGKFYFTIIALVLFLVLFKSAQQGLALPEFFGTILRFLSLPWAFGENIIFIIGLNVRRYAPALEVINQLGALVSIAFEIVLFYYIARVVFWRPGLKRIGLEKKQ